ncbi:hypothetical protein COCON_G00231200 [Conger conger]|uniref:Uncharacterized protein n=1 Tax=Conger conger TaxID=82655 RepID=A0A9Q1HN28_CONCO|nr:hypothetical protein COCON_G00231200 [Conger conger]
MRKAAGGEELHNSRPNRLLIVLGAVCLRRERELLYRTAPRCPGETARRGSRQTDGSAEGFAGHTDSRTDA